MKTIGVLGEYLRPVFPLQPHTQLLETARKLGEWSDFLVITANALHIFQENIEAASGCKVLSMIEVTLEEVERRPAGKVGVLGFGEPLIYQIPLDKLSIPYETLPVESRDRLDQAIWAVWEGRVGDQERQIASEVVDWLRARNTEMIILGCTEIPLLLGELADQPDLINPAQLLAEAAVRYAMQE